MNEEEYQRLPLSTLLILETIFDPDWDLECDSTMKRKLEEYDDDYKPLSKRMHSMYLKDGPVMGDNRLTVNMNAYGNASTSTQHNQQTATDYSHPDANNQPNTQIEDPQHLHYDPDLTSDQNPFYYESNRLLFDLYVERVHRYGQ